MKFLKTFARAICPMLGLLLVVPVQAAQKAGTTPNGANAANAPTTYETKKRQLSDIAVTIVTSGITCTCARFAEDIRDVVNDLRPDGLRVLPVMGVGGLQTLDDVLFLKGIDMGVADEDNLRLLKKRDPRLYADIEQRIRYITKLYNNEFHILARKDIQSIADLRGKKVSFNLKDSQTEVTADAIFEILKVQVERVNYDNNLAIKKLKDNEIQAMIVLSAAPQSALARLKKEDGVHLLGLDEKSAPGQDLSNLFEQYLPARFNVRAVSRSHRKGSVGPHDCQQGPAGRLQLGRGHASVSSPRQVRGFLLRSHPAVSRRFTASEVEGGQPGGRRAGLEPLQAGLRLAGALQDGDHLLDAGHSE